MKKLTSLISAAVIGLSAVSMNASAYSYEEVNEFIASGESIADYDRDGKVDHLDAQMHMTYYVLKQIHTEAEFAELVYNSEILTYIQENGDVDKDGKITPSDASYILHYCLETFEYGEYTYSYERAVWDNASMALRAYSDIMVSETQAEYEDAKAYAFEYVGELDDVNGDGVIDEVDATIICIEHDKKSAYYDDYQYGDIDLDGVVTAMDAGVALKYYGIVQTGKNPIDVLGDEAIAMQFLGDFDMSGDINASDASSIIKEYAKNQTNR
ncbi:MAG: hypothetical protein E7497_04785 [Ruminococcus sp.]|nr:hypothetical protein [Ruminococcus sp.]